MKEGGGRVAEGGVESAIFAPPPINIGSNVFEAFTHARRALTQSPHLGCQATCQEHYVNIHSKVCLPNRA
jgi:hypothetical protein